MTSFPELEVRHTHSKSDIGWTEKQAVDSALVENPMTVLMYCLHALHANVQDVFPPTTLATVVNVQGVMTEEGGATTDVGGTTIDDGGADEEVGGVEEEEDDDEEEEDEEAEDNAVTIKQISDWLKVKI